MSRGVFRDGFVHVCARMCSTCIFRPGNPMTIRPGAVEAMTAQAEEEGGTIHCHHTIAGAGPGEAVCRGFFERRGVGALRLAEGLGYVRFVEPPPEP